MLSQITTLKSTELKTLLKDSVKDELSLNVTANFKLVLKVTETSSGEGLCLVYVNRKMWATARREIHKPFSLR